MTSSLKGILAKLEKMDMDKIGAELLETLQGANRLAKGASELVNKPELQTTVDDLQQSLHSFKTILRKLDQRAEPLVENLENALSSGHKALEKVQETLNLLNEVLKPDSPFQFRWSELTEELAETARSIRSLVDLLERNPNAVIFGKDAPGEK
jgi:paraquat-inducible protein B